MSSESERAAAQLQAEHEHRLAQRMAARNYIQTHYGDLGLDEADRDEVLGALGLTDDQLSKNLGLYEARSLPKAGLGFSRGKAVGPHTPPSRGQ